MNISSLLQITHHGSCNGDDIINAKFSFETCMTIYIIPTTPTTNINTSTS